MTLSNMREEEKNKVMKSRRQYSFVVGYQSTTHILSSYGVNLIVQVGYYKWT